MEGKDICDDRIFVGLALRDDIVGCAELISSGCITLSENSSNDDISFIFVILWMFCSRSSYLHSDKNGKTQQSSNILRSLSHFGYNYVYIPSPATYERAA